MLMPMPIGLLFMTGAGNQPGCFKPRLARVPASATVTKMETMPFQNAPNAKVKSAVETERWEAPMIVPVALTRCQAPDGGRSRSIFGAMPDPRDRTERTWARLHGR